MTIAPEQSTAIERFATAAAAYCGVVEGEPGDGSAEMRLFAGLLATLHLTALDLPEVADDEAPEASRDLTTPSVRQRFAHLPVEGYWDVFDPLAVVPEPPVNNSLSDDLADIYHDLKRGLLLLAAEGPLAAAWEWRFHFHAHWGNHLVGAQRAIHLWLATAQ